jgi:hypothetical protein
MELRIIDPDSRLKNILVREDRLKSIEDKQLETIKKVDLLIDHVLQLGKKVDNVVSDRKSNYAAFDGMFQEILALLKALTCLVSSSVVPAQIQTQEPSDLRSSP